VVGGWRRQQNEELRNLYASPAIIRFMKSRTRWADRVALKEAMRNYYKVLVGKPEGKRKFGRPSRRCEDNIGMVVRKIGHKSMN
jgi:hypothetical protein